MKNQVANKKLVIIGANDFQNQLILKAKSLGFETHVFAWASGAIGSHNADHFYDISITDKDNILSNCLKIKPDGVVSIASDLAVGTVNYISENLGLPGNKIESTLVCTNKYEMRLRFAANGIPSTKFICFDASQVHRNVNDLEYPLIVKPTDRSGSRGVTKITKESELEPAIELSINNSFEKKAIVEEFIEGDEYSCECITYNSKHHFLTFTQKYTTGSPNFIETGHTQPSNIPLELQDKIKKIIFKALDSLGIENGASHSEFKIDRNGIVRIIEIGARMGGDCIGSDLVPISTGYDYLKMVIDIACGIEPDFKKNGLTNAVEIKFIFNQKDIDEMKVMQSNHPDLIYRISEITPDFTSDIIDSSTRLGYYIYYIKSRVF